MLVYRRHGPLPALDLKNKSSGGKGPLGRPDFYSKDTEHVKHLQMMLVTPGHDPGIYGPDKGGGDWAFGSFTEAEVNDFQEKKRGRGNLSAIWEFSKTSRCRKKLFLGRPARITLYHYSRATGNPGSTFWSRYNWR